MCIMPTNLDGDYSDAKDRATPQGVRREDCGEDYEMRPTLLKTFRETCGVWYRHGNQAPCKTAQRAVRVALVGRHGVPALLRWWARIKEILDRAEAEVEYQARVKALRDICGGPGG